MVNKASLFNVLINFSDLLNHYLVLLWYRFVNYKTTKTIPLEYPGAEWQIEEWP